MFLQLPATMSAGSGTVSDEIGKQGWNSARDGCYQSYHRCKNITKSYTKELAECTGINQTDISKSENGIRNPSVNLLKRLADGMGMALKIEFVPKQKA